MRRAVFLGIASIGLCAATAARGDALAVGGNGAPDSLSVAGETLVDSVTSPVTDSATGLAGTMTVSVYRETGGTLDFTYLFTNSTNSHDIVNEISASNFTAAASGPGGGNNGALASGYIDVGADSSNGGIVPVSVEWTTASTVNFTVTPPSTNVIGPGESSALLIIKTNATSYTSGLATTQDGGVVQVPGFEPGPEPSSMVLAGLGAFGLVGYGLRRRKARTA
jgi:hypothetical protein